VPPVLTNLRPDARVVSIGLVEVEAGWAATGDVGAAPYDIVWLTPRAKPEGFDYCAQFNAHRG
jgi:hypothetical protein